MEGLGVGSLYSRVWCLRTLGLSPVRRSNGLRREWQLR